MILLNKYAKKFPQDSVVYYVGSDRNRPAFKAVYFGIVKEYYHDALYAKLLHIKDNRLINGIPYNEFETPTRKKKLPKGWGYNTPLFETSFDNSLKNVYIDIKNSEEILKAYKAGYLIDADDYDNSYVESVIEQDGYYLKKTPRTVFNVSYDKIIRKDIFIPYYNAFTTYTEAFNEAENYNLELIRKSNLSDYEWTKENLIEELFRYKNMYNLPDDDINRIKEFLLSQSDFENLEFRISQGEFQFKNYKNKKWKNIKFA